MNDANDKKFNEHLKHLMQLLKIQSVSALPDHSADMKKAADYIASLLHGIGLRNVSMRFAQGHEKDPPIIYAERIDNPLNPTILVYGHYDVQPADPISEWEYPPFEPVIKNGNIYGRGTTDDKGQIMTHLAALSELAADWGRTWPLNIKLIFEGQEEMGGENLHAWLKEPATKKLLHADVALVCDTGFREGNIPAIVYGLRGVVYFQLDVKLSDHDLHSGAFGGTVLNPINALVHMLDKLYDANSGIITVPGFYDDVLTLDDDEKKLLTKIPFNEGQWLKDAGNSVAHHGEKGYTPKERVCARPSLDINGIWGGFMGEGAKTIIPSDAHAKFSCRLVPNQKPDTIIPLIIKYLRDISPKSVLTNISKIHSGHGVLIDRNSPWIKIAASSLQDTFGLETVFDRSGASIPTVSDFKNLLGLETLMFGYSLPDDNLHAPNEKYSLKQFELGIKANKLFYTRCAGFQ